MNEDFTIREPGPGDHESWLTMRMALWPSGTVRDHTEEMAQYLRDQELAVFLAFDASGEPCGFAEASLRSHAEDCSTRPVGYLEGIHVRPGNRQRGVGRALVAAVRAWALACGCREMASDCLDDNQDSIGFHQRVGFERVETLVHFRCSLPPEG